MNQWEKNEHPNLPEVKPANAPIKNILVYHVSGLTHGGTEKILQHIANGIAEDYNVFYMYGDKTAEEDRKATLHPNITLMPFSYIERETLMRYKFVDSNPHIKEVIAKNNIDLLITASPGYSHYPLNTLTSIPIILLNVFGAPTLQKNIRTIVYNSNTTRNHAEKWIGSDPRAEVRYSSLYKLPPVNVKMLGLQLREKLNIPKDDFVFGRIGRSDDAIFDPIGIRAWKEIAHKHQNIHLVVMSPAKVLIKIAKEENLPRVHLLPASSAEDDVWAFHGALDAMAHFRYDGETSGMAIAESLAIGNPIITHRSHIWNAHLEYLDSDFARVAETDNYLQYANFMEEYVSMKFSKPDIWYKMRARAEEIGDEKFSPANYSKFIKGLIINLSKHINTN